MVSDKDLIENYEKARLRLNKRVNYLVRNSPRYTQKSKILAISIILLTIAIVFLLTSVFFYINQKEVNYINNEYPTKVINNYPKEIIKETKEIHLEPDYVEECIKVREPHKTTYQLKCKKLEN